MKQFKIEIDEEVFEYLKSKAEPFVDSPNTVLRRELLNKSEILSKRLESSSKYPDLPRSVPRALRHTLEVIYLVRSRGMSRPDATKQIADKYSVKPQTVLDKYCRQLGKKAYEVDQMLDEPDLRGFKRILNQKYIEHSLIINKFLTDITDS